MALGEIWGREAASGLVICLMGEIGAGKTRLTKGIARGLGFQGRVHSPTFNLVNEYSGGRLPLYHIDLYRLESPREIIHAGLEEYFKPEGVTVIEWAERWLDSAHGAGFARREARIETLGENGRRIIYEDIGA
jgi:tRNA threonylcarbamoyladenosine biosynthesis protein TsaE